MHTVLVHGYMNRLAYCVLGLYNGFHGVVAQTVHHRCAVSTDNSVLHLVCTVQDGCLPGVVIFEMVALVIGLGGDIIAPTYIQLFALTCPPSNTHLCGTNCTKLVPLHLAMD